MAWYNTIASGGEFLWNNSLPGVATNSVIHGPTEAYNRTALGERGLDITGSGAAKQQQTDIRQSADRLRTLGGQAGEFYANSRNNAINRFDRAGGVYSGYQAPSYSRNAYNTVAARQGVRSSGYGGYGGGYGYAPQPQPQFRSAGTGGQQVQSWQPYSTGGSSGPQFSRAGSGGAPVQSWQSMGGPSYGGGLGDLGGGGGGGAFTNAQSYYDNYRAPTGAQNYYQQRQATGYGPNQVADRYSSRAGSSAPSYLSGNLGTLGSFAQGGTTSGGLMGQFQGRYAQPDQLDSRTGERRAFAQQPTTTSGALRRIDSLDPAQQSARQSTSLGNFNEGRMTNAFGSHLAGPNAESSRAMAGFDPTKTAGLGDTYSKLAAEGPTYEEEFYTSQLAGKNPAYEQLKADAMKDARNSAAARGGFVSGKAVENEGRLISRLAADEFANRGQLAAMAGSARRDRLGQQLEGASALDSQLLGQRGLGADVALRREGMLGDLSMTSDRLGLDKQGMLTDLSKFRDSQSLDKERLYSDTAGVQDDLLRRDQDAIDNLVRAGVDRDVARDQILGNLAQSDDTNRTSRMSDWASALGTADKTALEHNRDIDSLSRDAASATFDRERQLDEVANRGFLENERGQDRYLDAAKSADSSNDAANRTLIDAGSAASRESFDAFKTQFDAAMSMGDKQSAIDLAYDQLIGGNVTEAQIAAIEAEMAAAGIPLAQRNQFRKDAAGLVTSVVPLL